MDVRYLQNFRLDSSTARRAGHLEFGSVTTGNSLGDFLVGTVSSFQRTYGTPGNAAANNASERQNRAFFYGEDTWRVTSRLTLNYDRRSTGLRIRCRWILESQTGAK